MRVPKSRYFKVFTGGTVPLPDKLGEGPRYSSRAGRGDGLLALTSYAGVSGTKAIFASAALSDGSGAGPAG